MKEVIENAVFLVCSPRMPTPARSTGEGTRDGTRVEEIKQIVFSDAFLGPLAIIKSRVRRMLMRVATPLDSINHWMVPRTEWPAVKAEIEASRTQWGGLVQQMVGDLGNEVERLCVAFPNQATKIRANAISEATFRKGTRFVFNAWFPTADQMVEGGSLADEIGDLAYQVLDDLAKLVIDSKRDKSKRYDESSREFLGALAAKASSFAFVDQRIGQVATQLQEVVDVLPKAMRRFENELGDLVGAVFAALLDPGTLLQNGLNVSGQITAAKASLAPKQVPAFVVAPVVMAAAADKPSRARKNPGVQLPPAAAVAHNPVCI